MSRGLAPTLAAGAGAALWAMWAAGAQAPTPAPDGPAGGVAGSAAVGPAARAPTTPAEGRCEPIRVALRPTSAGLGAAGWLELAMAPSPFGITVSRDGRHVYDLTIGVERLRRRPDAVYVAWATTPELDRVRKLGVIGEDGIVTGRADWNKFLVLVTVEESDDGERWQGPILLTGLSPSGLMHTMRGHGIFEAHGIGC